MSPAETMASESGINGRYPFHTLIPDFCSNMDGEAWENGDGEIRETGRGWNEEESRGELTGARCSYRMPLNRGRGGRRL